MLRTFTTVLLCFAALSQPGPAASPASPDWKVVATALGKPGTEMPGGIYRVGLPRSDLTVTLDGVTLKATLALGSWLAFAPVGNKAVVMGDLVLTEEEVGPVMKKLVDEKIEITALHNHLFRAKPATFYMHVYGEGEAVTLARELHDALILSKTPLGAGPPGNAAAKIELDTAAIDRALTATGKVTGGVYQVGIPRSAQVTEHGVTLTAAMGAAESISFQPTGAGKAAITGDFVLTATEVNPVLRALRDNGIEVTALHNHMLNEQPRLFFMHFWANDDLGKLLAGLHAALQQVAVQRAGTR